MKFRFIYLLLLAIFAMLVLQSRSGGAAANGLGDRTGSPVGGAAGCSCHNSGFYTPSIAVVVKDAGLSAVTEYTPGQTYTIEYTVSAATGTPGGYGFQGLAISSTNAQAGTMNSAITPNTRITSSGGRTYAEQQGVNSAGFFQVSWTAPSAGFGDVSLYSRGLAVNGTGSTSGDQQTISNLMVLNEATTISYSQSSYCNNETDPVASVGGSTGGIFSASTVGMVIDSLTGEIDLSLSTPATYTITYTYGTGNTATTSVTLTAADDASFSYANVPTYCQNGTDPTPTIIGLTGGMFNSSTGIVVNVNTGEIALSSSVVGVHNVTYATNGACPNSSVQAVTILAPDSSQFNIGATSFCQGNIDPTPIGNLTAGTWFGSTGLVFNAVSGTIDLSASTLGTHVLSYLTSGPCPDSSANSFTLLLQDTAAFDFIDTSICQNLGTNVTLSVSGTTSGTYSASPSGLSFVNTSTGEIDVANSALGTYTLVYSSTGVCPTAAIATVSIVVCAGIAQLELGPYYKLYPNPNKGVFSIENIGIAGEVSIAILDLLGKVVHQQQSFIGDGESQVLELRHLTTGTYFVQLRKAEQLQTLKLNIH